MDTNATAEISNPTGADTSQEVTQSTSEETTEVKQNPESTGDSTTPEPAPRELSREADTKGDAEADSKESKRDPEKDDMSRRSFELTRREIELGVKEKGADYILNLDESSMDEVKRKEIDAAIKSIWGAEAKNLEEAKSVIKASQSSKTEEVKSKDSEVDIDDLVSRKVNEVLTARETETQKKARESEENEKLKTFIDSHEFLKPENDPNDQNWTQFHDVLQKINGVTGFTFEEKLDMALYKAFGDDVNSSPSANGDNTPSISSRPVGSFKKTPTIKDNPYYKLLSDTTKSNLEKLST